MGNLIYGVDPDGEFGPLEVRNALVKCFQEVHEKFTEKETDVEQLIRGFFDQSGDSFDNPNKEGIIKVCRKLADYSKQFRRQEEINKHYEQIMILVSKL